MLFKEIHPADQRLSRDEGEAVPRKTRDDDEPRHDEIEAIQQSRKLDR